MKLKFIVFFAIFNIFSCFAVNVKMPDAEILNKRLNNIGMQYFAEKTKAVSNLADKELTAIGVATIVETSLYDYHKYLADSMPANYLQIYAIQMQMNKPMLIKALLQDSPEAINELKEFNLL